MRERSVQHTNPKHKRVERRKTRLSARQQKIYDKAVRREEKESKS